jgi:hypothetical protein
LDPVVYQTEVLLRMRQFGAALDDFMASNGKLAGDQSLRSDTNWQKEIAAALDLVASNGRALAAVGPAPQVYRSIAGWMDRVEVEAQGLEDDYLYAVESGNPQDFSTAASRLTRMGEYLRQAYQEMLDLGWPVN